MKYIKLFEEFKSISDIEDFCLKNRISNFKVNEDLTVDVNGDVDLTELDLNKLPFRFGIINGDFDLYKNKLTTLENFPIKVNESICLDNNYLTSLEGLPEECNTLLCESNNIRNLIGSPKRINGSLLIAGNNLTSLEGAPIFIGGGFDIRLNPDLYSFENFPPHILGDVRLPLQLEYFAAMFKFKYDLIYLFNDYNIIKKPLEPGMKPRLKLKNLQSFLSENGFQEVKNFEKLNTLYDLK